MRNNDVQAVGKVPGSVIAVCGRGHRIPLTRQDQDGCFAANRCGIIIRNFRARPKSAGLELLSQTIVAKKGIRREPLAFTRFDPWQILGTGNRKIQTVAATGDELLTVAKRILREW